MEFCLEVVASISFFKQLVKKSADLLHENISERLHNHFFIDIFFYSY
jgi:hypothetical protein